MTRKPNYTRPTPEIIGSKRVPTGVAASGLYRVIVTPDAQLPYEDEAAMRAVEKYVAAGRWDEWVDLGDYLDFDFISSHNVGLLKTNEGKRFDEHFAYGREVLDRRLAALRRRNKAARMTMLEGNHDWRPEAYIDKRPEMEGLIDVARNLDLKDRGVEWVRCWNDGTIYRVGEAHFAHGLYTTQAHAKKMVESFCVNIFYGHVHDVQCYSKVMHGRGKVIVGQSLGCLCREDQSYIGNNPKNWQQAFGEFWFWPNGMFNYFVPRIFGGRFVAPDGKVYDGND